MKYTHRIRRCYGNRKAWRLVALRDDGSEIDTHGAYVTGLTLDGLLSQARGLLPDPSDVVQIVYYPEPQVTL